MTEPRLEREPRPALAVPDPTEVADSLPAEAIQYDRDNPPVTGSVQRGVAREPR